MKLDKILVPIDFSDVSRQAVSYGVSLAGTFGAHLTVLHVVEPAVRMPYLPSAQSADIEKQRERDARKHMERFLRQEIAESIVDRLVVTTGVAADEIIGFLEEEPTDLVVMGTHGRRAFRRWILGSVTERLIRTIHVPLLSVSLVEPTRTAAVLPGGQILYATDLAASAAHGMNVALDLANGFGARLHILHVMSPIQWEYGVSYLPLDIGADHQRLRAELETRLEGSIPPEAKTNPRVAWQLGEGNPWEVILATADRIDAGLVVINLHSRPPDERPKLGRTAEAVVRASERPVLALPAVDPGTPN